MCWFCGSWFQTATLSLTVDEVPSIINVSAKTARVGAPMNFIIKTRGYPKPSISLLAGTLPSGVTLIDKGNGTGVLTGAPAAGSVGTYNVTIGAPNGVGYPAEQAFTLVVRS
jgi:hypothetical protein